MITYITFMFCSTFYCNVDFFDKISRRANNKYYTISTRLNKNYILLCSSDHNESRIISTTAIAHGHPPWCSIIWNESTCNQTTHHTSIPCGTRMVPSAQYYMCALPEPEIALPQRSSDRRRKARKARQRPCFLHNSPSNSTHPPFHNHRIAHRAAQYAQRASSRHNNKPMHYS